MFGNQKMYKKGLADAMSAYEGFSEKQQAALEQLRQQVASGTDAAFDGLSEDLNGIYQYLSRQEKAALYQLDRQMDLKELEDQERRLLLAVLYQLAEDEGGEATEAQRAFIRSVQRYLEVTNPQTSVDLDVVGDIDSLDVQKLFLRVVLEFFYLRDGDEITEAQEEFLSNFSVNKKQASAIEASVSRLYNIVGAEGIAEKYGYVAEVQAEREKPPQPEVLREVVLIDWNFCIGNGEKKVFENQYIRLGTDVDVRGSLIFRNCTIEILPNCKVNKDLYDNGLRSPIDTCAFIRRSDSKAGNSQLLFEGCTFTAVSREEPDDDALEAMDDEAMMEYFMSSNETHNIGFYRAEVVNCTFRNNGCWEFYKGSAVRDSFFENTSVDASHGGKIENSTFSACSSLAISLGGRINNCKFKHMRCTATRGSLIRIQYGGTFTNCVFDDIELQNDSFLITGIGSSFYSEKEFVVKNCRFTNVRTSRHDRMLSRVTIEKEERTSLFKKEKKEHLIDIIDKPSCTGLEDIEWLDD